MTFCDCMIFEYHKGLPYAIVNHRHEARYTRASTSLDPGQLDSIIHPYTLSPTLAIA